MSRLGRRRSKEPLVVLMPLPGQKLAGYVGVRAPPRVYKSSQHMLQYMRNVKLYNVKPRPAALETCSTRKGRRPWLLH